MEQQWAQQYQEANALLVQGCYADADALIQPLLAQQQRYLGPEHLDTLETLHLHSVALQGLERRAEAEPILREELQIRQRVQGPEHADTLKCVDNLSRCLLKLCKAAEAEPMIRWVVNINQRVLGVEHRHTLASQSSLGVCLMHLGRYPEAEPLLVSALAAKQRFMTEPLTGAEAQRIADVMQSLADCYSKLGRCTEAEDLWHEVVDIYIHVSGSDHVFTISRIMSLALCLTTHACTGPQEGVDMLKLMEAEITYRLAWELSKSNEFQSPQATAAALFGLAGCQLTLSKGFLKAGDVAEASTRLAEAEALLQGALGPTQVALGEGHPTTLEFMRLLADCLLATGQKGKRKQAMQLRVRAQKRERRAIAAPAGR